MCNNRPPLGFSLLELMGVLLAVGLTAAFVVPIVLANVAKERRAAMVDQTAFEVAQIYRAVTAYVAVHRGDWEADRRYEVDVTDLVGEGHLPANFAMNREDTDEGYSPFEAQYRIWGIKDADGQVRVVITERGNLHIAPATRAGLTLTDQALASETLALSREIAVRIEREHDIPAALLARTTTIAFGLNDWEKDISAWEPNTLGRNRFAAFWGFPDLNADGTGAPTPIDEGGYECVFRPATYHNQTWSDGQCIAGEEEAAAVEACRSQGYVVGVPAIQGPVTSSTHWEYESAANNSNCQFRDYPECESVNNEYQISVVTMNNVPVDLVSASHCRAREFGTWPFCPNRPCFNDTRVPPNPAVYHKVCCVTGGSE